MKPNRGLGKGLSALFSETEEDYGKSLLFDEEPRQKGEGVTEIETSKIFANPNQPRKVFDETALKELADSIARHGVIMPIIVNKSGDRFMIIAGERRFRASKLAGLDKVPVIVKNYNERQIKEISLIENLQREDLNPIEAATAMRSLMNDYGMTQEELADRIGKSRPAIANTLRLLNLAPEVIKMVANGHLSAGHARTLISMPGSDQIKLAEASIKEGLSANYVHTLAQDSLGFVWIGTNFGLNRYDGKICKTYLKSEYPSLLRNDIRTIHTFSDGKLMIGSFFGCLLEFDPKLEVFNNLKPTDFDSTYYKQIVSFTETDNGSRYVNTSSGFYLYDEKSKIFSNQFETFPHIKDTYILSLYEDKFGRFWICSFNTLIVIWAMSIMIRRTPWVIGWSAKNIPQWRATHKYRTDNIIISIYIWIAYHFHIQSICTTLYNQCRHILEERRSNTCLDQTRMIISLASLYYTQIVDITITIQV